MKWDKDKVIKWVAIGIFVAFFLWGADRMARAEGLVENDYARISLGFGFTNRTQEAIVQELMVGKGPWYASVARIGGAPQMPDQVNRYAIGYRVHWRDGKDWQPYMRLGMAYWSETPEVISDHWSYDMAIGVRWRIVELEAQHNSTAGRSVINGGFDAVALGVCLPLPF